MQAGLPTRTHLGFVAKWAESMTPSLSSALHVGDGVTVTVMTLQRGSSVDSQLSAARVWSLSSALHVGDGVTVTVTTPQRGSSVDSQLSAAQVWIPSSALHVADGVTVTVTTPQRGSSVDENSVKKAPGRTLSW